MAITLRANQTLHDRLVAEGARLLRSKGYSPVYCDLPGETRPEQIGHYIPDITGYLSGELKVIAEAETGDTINAVHTADQWRTFAKAAARIGAAFVVIVPNGYRRAAEQRLRELGLTAYVWTF